MKINIKNTLLLLVLAIPLVGIAQRTISPSAAVEEAFSQHPTISAGELKVDRREALEKSAIDLSPTQFFFGIGQYNTDAQDIQWQVTQEFALPQVYGKKRHLLTSHTQLAQEELEMSKNDLRFQVRQAYFQWLYEVQKRALLDTIRHHYREFLNAAELRFQTGESSLIEKQVAYVKYQEVQLGYQAACGHVAVAHSALQGWLNTTDSLALPAFSTPISGFGLPDSQTQHPAITYAQQGIQTASAAAQFAQTQYLPLLSVGYFRQQNDGVGGFDAWQVGLSVPLWFQAKKAQVEGAKIEEKIAKEMAKATQLAITTQINQAQRQYENVQNQLDFYTTEGLDLADDLIESGTLAYRAGEIDYLAYMQNLTQAFTLQRTFLDTLWRSNQAAIRLAYLLGS